MVRARRSSQEKAGSGRTSTKQTNFSKTLKMLIPLYELYFVRMLIDSTTDDYSSGRDETTILKKHQLKKNKDMDDDFANCAECARSSREFAKLDATRECKYK